MSSIWEYRPTPESEKPWFIRDCERLDAMTRLVNQTPKPTEVPWLDAAYGGLEKIDDGLADDYDIARSTVRVFGCLKKQPLKKVAAAIARAIDRDMAEHGPASVFCKHAGRTCLIRREFQAMVATLITPEYRKLGMTLMPPMLFRYVPRDVEHRFFEIRPSEIESAGLGLFLRQGRHLRSGTIMAEYHGCLRARIDPALEHYTVQLKDRQYICALVDGVVTCLAGMANDNGTKANCELQEFADHPNRAFLVTLRDIEPAEEIFVKYGAAFWDAASYKELSAAAKSATGDAQTTTRRKFVNLAATSFCRCCRTLVERRIAALHRTACEDRLSSTVIPFENLDSLPWNPFTSCEDGASREDCNRAVYFVTNSTFTSGFTHETVLEDDGSNGRGGAPLHSSRRRSVRRL